MRTSFGIRRRSSETRKQEAASTKVVASPIEIELTADTVTARVGHMPSTMTNTGLRRHMPSVNSSHWLGGAMLKAAGEGLLMVFPSIDRAWGPVAAAAVAPRH